MFTSPEAKAIADQIRWEGADLRIALLRAFHLAGRGGGPEVKYFRNVLQEVQSALHGKRVGRLYFSIRMQETHGKPIVKVFSPRRFSCELSDVLVVVKYRRGSRVVAKRSVHYQAKLTTGKSRRAKIDQNQLELLTDWPAFEFGRDTAGRPRMYKISPRTLEYGSYLLAQRQPRKTLPCISPFFCGLETFAVAPHALAVKHRGPKTVDIGVFPYALHDCEAIFRQITYETGEPHELNPEVEELTEALYRLVGLSADPPAEFDGYINDKGRDSEDRFPFAIIEITVHDEQGKDRG